MQEKTELETTEQLEVAEQETTAQEGAVDVVEEQDIQTYVEQIKALQSELDGFKELESQNLEANIKIELLKSGLSEDFADLVQADSLEGAKAKISKLLELSKKQTIKNSYKPTDHKTENEYEKAIQKGDTRSAIKAKLANIF